MNLAYIMRPYLYRDILVKEMRKEFKVDVFSYLKEISNPENYDVIYVEGVNGESLKASQLSLIKKLIIFTTGVEIYQAKMDRLNWNVVDRLCFLSKHQLDYFKMRWGDRCKPKHLSVLPLPCPHEHFLLRKKPVRNNKVALIANITDRKGTYQIPRFLRMFPKMEIHHLGEVCLYGDPVREFVRWKLAKDGNSNRYFWQKHIDFSKVNNWLEDKAYIWLPTISEGFNRAVMEGMCKGLMPIVRRFAGSDDIWMQEFLYDEMSEIPKIMEKKYEPEKYRNYVVEKYHPSKIMEKFKTFL